MNDQILHALIFDGNAAMLMINASDATDEAKKLLNLSDGVTCALGRLFCAGAMLAQRNKSESEKLTLILSGGGPAGKLLVTADNAGNVKGCADVPDACRLQQNVSVTAVAGKDGQLTVIRDNPKGEPYVGVCNLVSGDITRDFAAYLVTSEQQPAAVALDAGFRGGKTVCGGIMVLPLPGCPDGVIDKIEEKICKTNDLLDKMLYHLSLEEMAFDMFWDVGVKPLETVPMQYKCDCSRERFESGLISLGKKELLSLAAENRNTEVCCRFCNKKYVFTPEEINQLAKGI